MAGQKVYLGFDFSTQQIKVVGVDENLKVVVEEHVKFDDDLPEFGTSGGVNIHDDKVTVTAPTAMWVKTLDLVLDRMQQSGFDYSKVAALSGDGQQCGSVYWKSGTSNVLKNLQSGLNMYDQMKQHGSVYWKSGTSNVLKNLQPGLNMYDQLKDVFSVKDSPVWMDASTGAQIQKLEEAVGGPMELARITGSRGFERFTGLHILKLFQKNKEAYDSTERISLCSSFAASLFLGDYAPIDLSDGSGMNLLDIRTKTWSSVCLDTCGPGLAEKLGEPVPSNTVIGNISSYLCSRYGFPADCKVVAFTGDNPASLAGLAPRPGDIIASLGSSDTVFLWLPEATPGTDGHIFINPLDQSTYMGLVCFKNGSLTRERIMQQCADGSWGSFNELLQQTTPGNNGNIGIYFDAQEIQPLVMGKFRFDENDKLVESFSPAVEVRAVLESQFLARLMYAQACGMKIGPNSRVIATGGASANKAILQVIADVFNSAVYVIDVPNSACLGGCYRAIYALKSAGSDFEEVVKNLPQPECVCTPTPGSEKVYTPMLERYRLLEKRIASM